MQKTGKLGLFGDNFFTEAVIIASFTGWAYLIAFVYESAYLQYFGLSQKLIVIDISSILFAFVAIGTLVLFVGGAGYYLAKPRKTEKAIFYEIRVITLCLLFFVGLPLLLYGWDKNSWIFLFVFFLFLLGRIHNVIRRKGSNFTEKLMKLVENDVYSENFEAFLVERLKQHWFMKFSLLLFSLYLASVVGNATAMAQRTFYIIEGDPELVIVTMYGDRIVALPLDRQSNSLSRKLYIMQVGDLSSQGKGISIERLGEVVVVK